ncbi:MAG TPA: DUF305 domain-containing protein [Gemmatimonadaceae bacterium]|nr:DUF305 domain-containing protein [Gemmatimonadaceae bacterium]
MISRISRAGALLVAAAALVLNGCAARTAPPARELPAPAASDGHDRHSASALETARVGYAAADVEFMQRMIHHHAQALVMTGLVAGRADRRELELLAGRIDASQRSEIESMRRWLEKRGEHAPDPSHAHHDAMTSMPGMLTDAQLAELRAATGATFDRLFLERMIQHHEGALSMVADLFATPGAGQESEIFRFATDVDADQRAEIARMRNLLNTIPATPNTR